MKATPYLKLALLAVACFCLAVVLQPRAMNWSKRAQSDNVLNVLFGDGRRLFANHFFVQADVTFHAGYYPSVFDQANKPTQSPMVSSHKQDDDHEGHDHAAEGHDEAAHVHDENCNHEAEEAHEKEMAFLGRPRDWIESFGRKFIVTEHTHLAQGGEREILPWLRISASLDPQRVETYTVSAYWLRSRLGKVREAEQFLREGLRANPSSPEILFELGRLYNENDRDANRARNVWDLALRRWNENESKKSEPNEFLLEQVSVNLGRLEEVSGNYEKAISHYERAKGLSPNPDSLESQIQELKQKISVQPPATQPAVP